MKVYAAYYVGSHGYKSLIKYFNSVEEAVSYLWNDYHKSTPEEFRADAIAEDTKIEEVDVVTILNQLTKDNEWLQERLESHNL